MIEILCADLLTRCEAKHLPKKLKVHRCNWWTKACRDKNCILANNGREKNLPIIEENAVRPALTFKGKGLAVGDRFTFGGVKFVVISGNRAFCENDIGKRRFDSLTNRYEKSELKTFIDEWFRKAKAKEALKDLSAEEVYEAITPDKKDALYRRLWLDYVKEDVLARLEDTRFETDKDEEAIVDIVADRYVYNGRYDCNINYWDNIDNLIEEVIYRNKKGGNKVCRIKKRKSTSTKARL